jgi:hypothetical protein
MGYILRWSSRTTNLLAMKHHTIGAIAPFFNPFWQILGGKKGVTTCGLVTPIYFRAICKK